MNRMLAASTVDRMDDKQRQSFIANVFNTHSAEAARQLREEATSRFPDSAASLFDICDHVLGDQKAEASLANALEFDDGPECLRVLKEARGRAIAAVRTEWVLRHTEERVWALYHKEQ